MLEFIIIIFILFFIFIKTSSTSNSTLETLLKRKKFLNITIISETKLITKKFITATKNNMKYLFVKNYKNIPHIDLNNNIMQAIQQISKNLNCDRVIIYYYSDSIPIELTKLAASYNIEIWNMNGTSNFESYRATQANTNNSRLAKTLTKENEPLEYRKNGVIAKDTCHIAPTISPIQTQTKKSIFKKNETQKL